MANGNHLYILQQIRRKGSLTRRALAESMTLGMSMISRLTTDLLSMRLIREIGRSETASGRPSDLLALEPSAAYAIGLDIGGSHQRAVLVNLVGELVASEQKECKLPTTREAIVADIAFLVESLIVRAQVDRARIYGVGVGLWGSVDPLNGVVYSWTETPELYSTWKNFPLRDALRTVFPFPYIYIDDIVRTMGQAEMLYGRPETRSQDYVFALADSGVGVALMINGTPYVGPNQLAGEIGHVPVIGGTLPCSCGNIGCLETVASSTAILGLARRRLAEINVFSSLREVGETLTIHDVLRAVNAGDKLAYQLMVEAGEKFGIGLAIALNLLGPQLVIVGGVLSHSPVYLDAAQRVARLQALSKVTANVNIVASTLDDLSGARGAASQVLNTIFLPGEHNILSLSR